MYKCNIPNSLLIYRHSLQVNEGMEREKDERGQRWKQIPLTNYPLDLVISMCLIGSSQAIQSFDWTGPRPGQGGRQITSKVVLKTSRIVFGWMMIGKWENKDRQDWSESMHEDTFTWIRADRFIEVDLSKVHGHKAEGQWNKSCSVVLGEK